MKQDELKLWLDLLACQTELTLPLELPHFYMCPEWMSARSVLDLGTGPGSHLHHLAKLFPEKSYVGIDIEESYIEVAREGALAHTRFLQTDLFQCEGQYPIVMARLVAQHLPSLNNFLCKVRDLLSPGGCFISIEPNDGLRLYHPELPNIMRMFKNFKQAQYDKGLDRDAGATMAGLAQSCGLQLEKMLNIVIPSSIPSYKELFIRFHLLIFELFSGPFEVALNRNVLEDEFKGWIQNETAFTQLGICFSTYRKQQDD